MGNKGSLDLAKIFREKQLLVLGALGLLLLVVVLGPVSTKLRERVATRRKLNDSLEKLETKLDVLGGVDSILIDERVRRMEAVFPSKKPVVELMGTLSQLSGQHGLSFGGVSLSPGTLGEEEAAKVKKGKKKTATPSELRDLKFGFQVGGAFADILAFMTDLENVAPVMKIEEVALSIKTNPLFEEAITVVVADINVAAFYQAPPKTLGAISTPVELLSREDEALLKKLVNFKTFEAVFPVAPTGKVDLFGSAGQDLGE
jgi:hypothetical protein